MCPRSLADGSHRRELGDELCTLAGIGAAIHPPDARIAGLGPPLLRLWRVSSEVAIEVARGVFVIGEDQHLSAPQFTRQQPF